MTTRVEMLNRALLRLGADPIVSDADPAAAVHLAVYDSVAEQLAAKPWTFLKQTRRLARLIAAPVANWPYAYQLPADRDGPPRALYADQTMKRAYLNFDIQGDTVRTDAEQLWCQWTSVANPARWPGDFREGFTLLLMSELALSIREDRVLRDKLRVDAVGTPGEGGWGGMIGQALHNDNAAEPDVAIGGGLNPLIDGRWGG